MVFLYLPTGPGGMSRRGELREWGVIQWDVVFSFATLSDSLIHMVIRRLSVK